MYEGPSETAATLGPGSPKAARGGRFRPTIRRLLLVSFGVLVALLISELGLQAASRLFGFRAAPATSDGGGETILAVGDSHTYGVFYSPEEAYPGQLDRILEEREPGRFRVINLGLPGMNSSEVASRLDQWLLEYRPSIVIACVGMNNVWNETDTSPGDRTLLGKLRLVRFVRLLWLASTLGPPRTDRPELTRQLVDGGLAGVEHHDAVTGELLIHHSGNIHERLPVERARRRLHRDLGSMLRITEAAGAKLILLSYAGFFSPLASEMDAELRLFSRERGVAFVEARDRFRELLANPETPRTEYFHTETDSHPNARGYAELAALVADHISSPAGAVSR